MTAKMKAVISGIIVISLVLSGCWDRREPDLLGIAMGMGIDVDEETGMFRVIAQIANPLGLSQGNGGNGSGGGDGTPPAILLSARGLTLFEASRNLEVHSTRELTFSHVEILLLSESAARQGMGPIMDFVERKREVRLQIRPIVVEGDLEELMSSQFPMEEIPAIGISRQLLSVKSKRAVVPRVDFRQFVIATTSPGMDPIVPRIAVGNVDQETEEDSEAGPDGDSPAELQGAAVFQRDRMVGWLTGREVRGFNWKMGNLERATLVIPLSEGEAPFSVEIIGASCGIEPILEGDDIRFAVDIRLEAVIMDQVFHATYEEETEFTRLMNREVARMAQDDIEAVFSKSQELEADVLGLGNLIYRRHPERWRELEDNWRQTLSEVTLDLEVSATIRRTGHILTPSRPR